jgi:hypothetical protein
VIREICKNPRCLRPFMPVSKKQTLCEACGAKIKLVNVPAAPREKKFGAWRD